jgi:aminobenzoyl-glutamate transport protein
VGAKLIDPTYKMGMNGSFIFGIVGTISLAFLISYITEKYTAKRLAKYKIEEVFAEEEIPKKKKRKALRICLLVTVLLIVFFVYMLIPIGTPLSGLLLDYDQKDLYARIFSPNSFVAEGLSFIILAIMLLCGWIYGSITGTLKNSKGAPNYLYNSLSNLGGVLILLFFASQLIALFQKSNIGTVFTIWIANFVDSLSISGLPLILLFFILILLVNVIEPSSMTKLAILGPIVTPEFMKANVSPEFMQAVFKLGETVSDIMTPLFPYFIDFLGVITIYSKKNESIKIREIYKLLFPYFVAITIFWIIFILCWYIINVPISQGILPTL